MSFANLAVADLLCWGADCLVAFQEFPIVPLYDGLDVFGAAVGQLHRGRSCDLCLTEKLIILKNAGNPEF